MGSFEAKRTSEFTLQMNIHSTGLVAWLLCFLRTQQTMQPVLSTPETARSAYHLNVKLTIHQGMLYSAVLQIDSLGAIYFARSGVLDRDILDFSFGQLPRCHDNPD